MASLNPISGALGRERAAHLLRRATFGPTKQEIDSYAAQTIDQALTSLFTIGAVPPAPPNDAESGSTTSRYFKGWWLDQMLTSGLSVQERMIYFLHTHFTTKESVVGSAQALHYQNALFRFYALGNFKTLSRKICLDNAMLVFLDSILNVNSAPNENFAREFFELYTIGKGPQIGPEDYTNYTERDVQEGARVLSGYTNDSEFLTLDADTSLPAGLARGGSNVASSHDPGVKTFSEKFQGTTISPSEMIGDEASVVGALTELDDLVDMIFNQDETARHICRKLYRFFMYYEINDEIENDIIVPLANTFRSNDYEFQPVLDQLFRSEHFYDADNAVVVDDNQGAIIKAPLDLVIGSLRYFKIQMPDSASEQELFYDGMASGILDPLRDQGLNLYEPFEVAGYPAYHQNPVFNRNWISVNYLARRYQYIDLLINNQDDWGFSLDIVSFIADPANISNAGDATTLVTELVESLFPEIITTERFDYFLNEVLLDSFPISYWATEWTLYQGSNDDIVVRGLLERLIRGLLQTPEYQLY